MAMSSCDDLSLTFFFRQANERESALFLLHALSAVDLIAKLRQPQINFLDFEFVDTWIRQGHKLFVSLKRLLVLFEIIMRNGYEKVSYRNFGTGGRQPFILRQGFGKILQLKESQSEVGMCRISIRRQGDNLSQDRDRLGEASCLHQSGGIPGGVPGITRIDLVGATIRVGALFRIKAARDFTEARKQPRVLWVCGDQSFQRRLRDLWIVGVGGGNLFRASLYVKNSGQLGRGRIG